jgi:hypothetical protein
MFISNQNITTALSSSLPAFIAVIGFSFIYSALAAITLASYYSPISYYRY